MGAGSAWNEVIAHHLGQTEACWSAGTYGALAEFLRDPGEPAQALSAPFLGWRTPRGALAIDCRQQPWLVAYETLSRYPGRWQQGLVLGSAASDLLPGPSTLTDLGADFCSLREEELGASLFDLGLGRPGMAFCIRSDKQDLIRCLSAKTGRSLFDPDNPARALIKQANPTRVVITPLGRLEVYQPIGTRLSKTPLGPHTHLLPRLLASGRQHEAQAALPHGFAPLMTLYPASPFASGGLSFDRKRHAAQQDLVQRFAETGYLQRKAAAIAAIRAGHVEICAEAGDTRSVLQIALRQLLAEDGLDKDLATTWQRLLEPQNGSHRETEGHHAV